MFQIQRSLRCDLNFSNILTRHIQDHQSCAPKTQVLSFFEKHPEKATQELYSFGFWSSKRCQMWFFYVSLMLLNKMIVNLRCHCTGPHSPPIILDSDEKGLTIQTHTGSGPSTMRIFLSFGFDIGK